MKYLLSDLDSYFEIALTTYTTYYWYKADRVIRFGRDPTMAKHLAEKIGRRLHSDSDKPDEVQKVIQLLEKTMDYASNDSFRQEVGTFKFLNEIIRLISPLSATSQAVPLEARQRLMALLSAWSQQYPHLSNIKEAHEMLAKQGAPDEHYTDAADRRTAREHNKPQRAGNKTKRKQIDGVLQQDDEYVVL